MPELPPISRFPIPDPATLPDDIRAQILAVQEKTGFIPNVFLALAHRPDQWRGFFALHDAVMKHDSSLTKAEKEMIVVTVSGGNECHYCVIAHGAVLRIIAKHSQLADQLAINYRKADISPRQRAMLDFAVKVSSSRRPSRTPTTPACASTASATRTSGTSVPSAPFSVSPTGWRT